jgi:hypothetical protein
MRYGCRKGVFWSFVVVSVLLLASMALAQEGAGSPTPGNFQVDDITGVGQVGVSVYLAIQATQIFGKLADTLSRFTDNFGRFTETFVRLSDAGLKLEDVRTHAGAVTELSAALRNRAQN